MGDKKDDGLFFGASPEQKKDLKQTEKPKGVDMKSLDFNALDRDKYNAPEKVGESVRLIDLAMGGGPKPPKLKPKSGVKAVAPRPGAKPGALKPGAARPAIKPGAARPAVKPGAPARPG